MKTICSVIALTIALPSLAFAQTTTPAASEHSDHDMPHMDHSKMAHEEDMDCQKLNADGKKSDCCEQPAKKSKDKAATDLHAGHEAH